MDQIKVFPDSGARWTNYNAFPRRVKTIFPKKNIGHLKPKMITCTMLTVLLSALSIFIAVVENRAHKVRVITINSFTYSLRLALIATSFLQGLLLIFYWSLRSKVNKAYNMFFSKSGVFAGNDCKKLMTFEFILISIVQPYTYNIVIFDNDYSFVTLDDLITICVLCRSYFLFKLLYDASYYNSYRAQWVG